MMKCETDWAWTTKTGPNDTLGEYFIYISLIFFDIN